MAAPLHHLGLRFNTNPTNPFASILKTYDLAQDSPQNYNPGRRLVSTQVVDYPIPEFVATEVVRVNSTRGRNTKGLGTKLGFDLAITWQTGNPPTAASTFENMVGTTEADLWEMQNFFGVGMTSFADGISTYCWLSPNLDWHNPTEQWIRVVPAPGSFKFSYGSEKVYTRTMTVTLISAINYKNISRQYARRGFEYVGAGTASTSGLGFQIVGVGTSFLSDFIKGDYIVFNNGEFGRIATVVSDTLMTVFPSILNVHFAEPYTVRQRSVDVFSVPIYTLTPFGPVSGPGWGASGWGESWGN